MKQALINWVRGMQRPRMERRIPAVLFCIAMMGVCVALLDRLNFGTDPCSCMNLGVSRTMGWSFGTWQLVCNAVLFLIVIRFDTSRIGLGTFANMIGVGYVAEGCMALLDLIPAFNASLPLMTRLLIFVPVMITFLLVVAVYIVVDMGVAPYDAMPQIIAKQTGLPFRWTRTAWDIAVMIIGFAFGSTVGPVTLCVAFFLGPIVGPVAKKIEPFFN